MLELVVILALAGGLGFVLGLILGARRALSLVMSGRALRSVNGRLVASMPGAMPERSAADVLAGIVRIWLGGTAYELTVLPRAASRRWLESLEGRFAALAVTLEQAGDDAPTILTALLTETDALYDMLLSYDAGGVLPPRAEVDEVATDAQILHAVLEVWRAVNPLVGTLTTASPTDGPSSEPPSSWPASTAGRLTTSSDA